MSKTDMLQAYFWSTPYIQVHTVLTIIQLSTVLFLNIPCTASRRTIKFLTNDINVYVLMSTKTICTVIIPASIVAVALVCTGVVLNSESTLFAGWGILSFIRGVSAVLLLFFLYFRFINKH